jgi:hypothetical protein
MRLPDWLYKALPFIYVVTGALAVCNGKDFTGQCSGALLIFAALLIWTLRKERGTS